jgi:hypothetical protein
MDKAKFTSMLESEDAEKVFNVMANCKSYFEDTQLRGAAEDRYSLATARYVQIKLSKENFDASDPLEADLWKCLIEYELMRREETGRKSLSTYTRRNIVQHGIIKAVEISVIRGKFTYGKNYLINKDRPSFSFESVVLKHPDRFQNENVIKKAKESMTLYSDKNQ